MILCEVVPDRPEGDGADGALTSKEAPKREIFIPLTGREYRNTIELKKAMRAQPDEFPIGKQFVLIRASKILQRAEERVSRVVEVKAKKGGFIDKPIKKDPAK